MKILTLFVVGLLTAGAALATAQTQTHKETKIAPMIVTGEVVRYEPGRLLVVRADGKEISYSLNPSVVVAEEVQVGRTVSVHIERGKDGATAVTQVTTTSITPEGQVKRTTEETRVEPSGATTRSKVTTVMGEVVRYVPGRNIVLRDAVGKEIAFDLGPGAAVPAEIQVGQKVTLYTEPGPDGSTTVARVTTTTITPEGQMRRTVEETRTKPSGETTRTTTITVQGKVEAYAPGKSITVLRPDGTKVTYLIGEGAKLPADVSVGKTVTLRTVPVVETIIIDKN